MYRSLVLTTLAVAFVINLLSAFVRLTDAGVGCAGWPDCYGRIAGEGTRAPAAQSASPLVDEAKAAVRLVHRLFATLLGFMILGIAVLAFRDRGGPGQAPAVTALLLALMVMLAMVGRVTVHPVMPAIATVNAAGGIAVVACLAWLTMAAASPAAPAREGRDRSLGAWAAAGLGLVILQVVSGVWVSTNFAALGCGEFPLCRGAWVPAMDFGAALDWGRPAGAPLVPETLAAIHWTHRLAAAITLAYLAVLAIRVWRVPGLAGYGVAIGGLGLAEAGLGIANVMLGLPLAGALAHNALGALLLVAVTMLNFTTRTSRS
ncbi:MAG: COX15/CtaA family protein [Betaproteobacteria bacterium]|nr:COX15/CtaA family protein [Betaproteobacteria bacterium]